MTKTISVTDENGNILAPTYPKRAKGLIKHGRARAIGDDAIVLLNQSGDTPSAEECVPSSCKRHATALPLHGVPRKERNEHMNNNSNHLDQVIATLLEDLRKPIDNLVDMDECQIAVVEHHRENMLDKLLTFIKEQKAEEEANAKEGFLKAELEELKARVDSAEKGPERDKALAVYGNALQQYMGSPAKAANALLQQHAQSGTYNGSEDSKSYDFSDLPNLPNFLKQHINKGWLSQVQHMVQPYLKQHQQEHGIPDTSKWDGMDTSQWDSLAERFDRFDEILSRIDDLQAGIHQIESRIDDLED